MQHSIVSEGKRPVNRKNRRRKKRRTEDFSSSEESSSSSSSNSSSESENESENEEQKSSVVASSEANSNVASNKQIMASLQNVIDEDEEEKKEFEQMSISSDLRKKLNGLEQYGKFQKSRSLLVNKISNLGAVNESLLKSEAFFKEFARKNLFDSDKSRIANTKEENDDKDELKDKSALLDEYLSLMMSNHDADLDVLRTASDLNSFSLPILATLLKEGGNMFDYESLNTIVNYK